jgi:cell division protein FtsB
MIRNADVSGVSIGVVKERRQGKSLPVEVLGLLYFAAIVIAGIILVWQPATVAQMNERSQELEITLKDLKMRNEDLKKTVSSLESLDYIEHEARTRLGMVDPSVVKTITVKEDQTPQVIAVSQETVTEKGILSLLSRIAQVFGTKQATAKGTP